jgi:predicted O-linked N-acetylglucosamine transferase (SPINDLY family)
MPSHRSSSKRRTEPSQQELDQLTLLFSQGPQAAAEAMARSLTERFAGNGFGWKVLGVLLLQQLCFAESAEATRTALSLLPKDASIHNNLAAALLGLNQLEAAEACCMQALAIAPGYAKAHSNLSKVLRAQGKLEDAEKHCRAALESDPNHLAAHFGLGNLLELQNKIPEAIASYRAALAIDPANPVIFSDMLHLMSHDVHTQAGDNLAAHQQFGDQFEGPLRGHWPSHPNSKVLERCIKVGFVSSDAYDHALANYIEPLFRLLNKKPGLEVHLYYTHAKEDAVTRRLRGYFRHWHDVAALSDAALEQQIRSDAIDILVDVNGHTVMNKLQTFARKPAPIQISWLGYLGTTGLQAMDYYAADPYWIPPGQLDWQFVEKIAYLPSAVVFEPNANAPKVNPLPALANGYLTFGSFNRHNKVNDAVIALWSMLLNQVAGSKLKLGGIPEEQRQGMLMRFANQGVAAERVSFFKRTVQTDYLAQHHQVDFCLDTFPFCGGATSAHAAWMGVPTLTLAGELPASRLGATEMHHLGLDGFVADSIEDFVEKGLYWAIHLAELAQLRAGLRERFSNSPMGQTLAFANHFEAMLRSMWQRWCQDIPAQSFMVEASATTEPQQPEQQAGEEPADALLESLLNLNARQEYAQLEELARALTHSHPDHGAGWKYLGSALRALGRLEECLELQRATAARRPDDYEAHFNLATELQQQGHFDDAVRSYLSALSLQPNNPAAYNNLANIFKLMSLDAQAEMYCRQALALKPDMAGAVNNLGNALQSQGRHSEAEVEYRRALELKPDWAEVYNNLAICLKDQGYASEAEQCYRKALALKPDWAAAHSNLLFSLSLDVQTPPDQLHAEHLAYGQVFETALSSARLAHANHKDPLRRLQIGFVSADLYDHAMASFLEPLFKGLAQHADLELHAYYGFIYEDAVTERLRNCFARWNKVGHLSEQELAAKIHADQIDILIDLSGHTAHNRMLTFARKPAPVQATYLGYLGTSGLQSMDYFVCDAFWVPPGQLDWQFSEKMAYLPGAVVFTPSAHAAEVNPLPALSNGHVTFGSFNRPNKLNPSVIALWSMLLQAVPTAHMVLGGIAPERQEELFRQFMEHGIDINRLTFFPRSNIQDYLALHHQVDFCLDTFPYGGGATNANAAWMGVPTLCLAGETPASRFGPTAMHILGLDGFIADSIEDFVAKGCYWAEHTAELAALRAGMRQRFHASAMGQPQAFADHFRTLLRAMWQRWCDDLPPDTLYATAPQSTTPPTDLAACQAQCAADPTNAALHNNLGVVWMGLEQWDAAEAALMRALDLTPGYGKALVNLAAVLRLQGRPAEAEARAREALRLDSCDAAAWIELGNALEVQEQFSQAQACYYKADMAHEPRRAVAHSNLLYLMNHDVMVDPVHLVEEHMAFGETFEAPLRGSWHPHHNDRDSGRTLRVGFVSGDFCQHALSAFLDPVLKALSTCARLSLVAYSTRAEQDAVSRRLQAYFGQWHDVPALSHDDLAEKIRSDAIDILIDLSGHTARNRLLAFAHKPAPIQVGWIGYLGTSGMQAMDYYLCDPLWLGVGDSAWQFSEQLAYLPAATLFAPDPLAPAVQALPALTQGHITFGSFNRISKINDSVIALWSMLMHQVTDSTLLLVGIEDDRSSALAQTFASHGIEAARLVFLPRLATADYLAAHHLVDVCLDTYPHSGGATTAHAAWMGVPTLCLAGETPASRFGASLMLHLGLPHCVAYGIDAFVQTGQALCQDLERLSAIRSSLRSRFSSSAMGQPQAFAQHFESALRTMWTRWCEGTPPSAIDVSSAVAPPAPATQVTVVSATKLSEQAFWSQSALGQSMRQQMDRDPRLSVSVAFENQTGLSELFNRAIEQAADDALLVFIHDDVWIDEPFFVSAVLAGLAQFDVIGVAGNRRVLPQQPAWPFTNLQFTWDDKSHLSGRVAHSMAPHGQASTYGACPARCRLLDGVFMAARKQTLQDKLVRFDPQFDFHFYDLDFCRSVHAAGLTMGTWPVDLTHQSGGTFGSPRWLAMYERYKDKWAHAQPQVEPLRLFIGHKPPDFGVWPGFTYCGQKSTSFTLPADAQLDQLSSDVLSEYHSLFLLRRALVERGVTDGRITICQHRRFVLNVALGEVAVNLPSSWLIDAKAAATLDTALLAPREGDFLIASPMGMPSTVLDQFHVHHPLRDMLRFYADLMDARLINAADVHNILTMKLLIPAPSCGTFSVEAFLEIYTLLEKCVAAWHSGGYQPHLGYQKRITGFLLERLHSYLLISHMTRVGVNFEAAVGYTTVVAEGNRILPGR